MIQVPRIVVSRARVVFVACGVCFATMPAVAQVPARLVDKDVKALIDQVDTGRDKFEGNLDGAFKGSTVRSANGDIKVAAALQDYQDSTKKLQDRFGPEYSAGNEAATVLKQSTAINTFMMRSAPTMKGRSEWDRQAANLQKLAAAYGTTFPLAEGATVARMNDKEVAAAASAIGESVDGFKRDLDKATGLTKPDRDAAKKDMDLIRKQAEVVKSRISGGKPASSEVGVLITQVAGVQPFVGKHALSTNGYWQAVQASLATIRQAFGLGRN